MNTLEGGTEMLILSIDIQNKNIEMSDKECLDLMKTESVEKEEVRSAFNCRIIT
jgi:hypothetical protein